jgi:hypothetical protein
MRECLHEKTLHNGCNDFGGWHDAAWKGSGAANSRLDSFAGARGKGSTFTGR